MDLKNYVCRSQHTWCVQDCVVIIQKGDQDVKD